MSPSDLVKYLKMYNFNLLTITERQQVAKLNKEVKNKIQFLKKKKRNK